MSKNLNPFADLEDDGAFDAELNSGAPVNPHLLTDPTLDQVYTHGSSIKGAMFETKCKACKGSGAFYSYTGRYVGQCFKCHGTGIIKTKTDPVKLEAARVARNAKKVRDANAAKDNAAAFLEAHPDIAEWFTDNASWMDFARSLRDQLIKKGSLGPKQISAAERSAAKMAAKKAAKAVEHSADDSELDISELSGYYAVPQGETRLKVRISHPRKDSRWFGTTFVDDGAAYGQRRNYGRQAPGANYNGKIQKELAAILANPIEAQQEYGRLTGTCGACGRHLEDEASIELGIGPICRGKLGM